MFGQQPELLLAVLQGLFGNYLFGYVYPNTLNFRNAILILQGNELPVGPLKVNGVFKRLFDQQFVAPYRGVTSTGSATSSNDAGRGCGW